MKFNYKSRKGFTLIELLVVIGILAVLAAIAIPSVAGLIDRANVSSDATNSNEMTNAVERFTSEYELYKQDIASGKLDVNNLDGAQGRVYNVTGATTRKDISDLESIGFNGKKINIDTNYPANYSTTKSVIENYMKTSSSTFEPKQSDKSYWYHKITGYTVVADTDTDVLDLYEKLPSDIKYTNNQPSSISEWINLSSNIVIPDMTIEGVSKTPSGSNYSLRFYVKVPKENVTETFYYLITTEKVLGENNGVFDYNTAPIKSASNPNVAWEETPDSYIKTMYITGFTPSTFNSKIFFRVAYPYTENGVEKFTYSSIYEFTINELSTDEPNFN